MLWAPKASQKNQYHPLYGKLFCKRCWSDLDCLLPLKGSCLMTSISFLLAVAIRAATGTLGKVAHSIARFA